MTPVFDLAEPSNLADEHVCAGDPLYDWYASSDGDWEECRFIVPRAIGLLQVCASETCEEANTTYVFEAISWEGSIDLLSQLESSMNQHRVITQILEENDKEASIDGLGDVRVMQH